MFGKRDDLLEELEMATQSDEKIDLSKKSINLSKTDNDYEDDTDDNEDDSTRNSDEVEFRKFLITFALVAIGGIILFTCWLNKLGGDKFITKEINSLIIELSEPSNNTEEDNSNERRTVVDDSYTAVITDYNYVDSQVAGYMMLHTDNGDFILNNTKYYQDYTEVPDEITGEIMDITNLYDKSQLDDFEYIRSLWNNNTDCIKQVTIVPAEETDVLQNTIKSVVTKQFKGSKVIYESREFLIKLPDDEYKDFIFYARRMEHLD